MCNVNRLEDIRNTDIRSRTKVKDLIESVIDDNKKRWAGLVQDSKTIGGQSDQRMGTLETNIESTEVRI